MTGYNSSDSDRPEYVIHAKLKNNLLLSRILERYSNVAEFCTQCGLSQSVVGEFINLKLSAITKMRADWRPSAIRIAQALSCEPDDLFSEEQKTVQLASNEAYVEMRSRQIASMTDPMLAIENAGLFDRILNDGKLSDRQRNVLRLRYQFDKTLDEAAATLNVTRERVRQIEAKALSKLRHPSTTERLVKDAIIVEHPAPEAASEKESE